MIVVGTDTARVKATGKTLDFNWVHSFTVKNDKIVSFSEYGDMSAVAAELRTAAARV